MLDFEISTTPTPLDAWLLQEESPFMMFMADKSEPNWATAEKQFALFGIGVALPWLLAAIRTKRHAFLMKEVSSPCLTTTDSLA